MKLLLAGAILALTVGAGSSKAEVFEGAEWLGNPLFEGLEPIDFLGAEEAPTPAQDALRNVHTLYRTTFELEEAPVEAHLRFSAKDHAKVYINEALAVQGPAPGYPFAYPFEAVDVTDQVTQGVNVIGAHTYYHGLRNRVWHSGDNREGLVLALELRFPDGRTERIVTDGTWRCHSLAAFPASRAIGDDIQFAEDVDMRLYPQDWRARDFDDSAWDAPLTGEPDLVFVPPLAPPLEVRRATPERSTRQSEGQYIFDFGHPVVGHTRMRVTGGEAGESIEVRHGEELETAPTGAQEVRVRPVYQEHPVLSGAGDLIEFHAPRAFRYVEVGNAPNPPRVWVDVRHHPFAAGARRFTVSEPVLERAWGLGVNQVRYASQEGFQKYPSLDRGQHLGEAVTTSRSHMLLTGGVSLTKKSLFDFANSARGSGSVKTFAPASVQREIAEYSLQWPLMLEHYHQYSGDLGFLQRMADEVLEGLHAHFAEFENEAGLLEGLGGKSLLAQDSEHHAGEAPGEVADQANAVVNAFYYGALQTAGDVMEHLGRDPAPYREQAARVKEAYQDQLYDSERRLFRDAPGRDSASLCGNALALRFGLAPSEAEAAILGLIREKGLNCGPDFAPYVIEACFGAGAPDLALDLIALRDPSDAYRRQDTRWRHPAGASPVYLIAEYLLGLQPGEPGWERLRFAPEMSERLESVELEIPLPEGRRLSARYDAAEGFQLTLPAGMEAEVIPEDVNVTIEHDAAYARQLEPTDRAFLQEQGWSEYAGDGLGVWISVEEQRMRLVEEGRVLWDVPCGTASRGTGQQSGSDQTPLGWHSVEEKFGAGAPWGQRFIARAPTDTIWSYGDNVEEDMVLSRILWLGGLEEGKNKGGEVDSYHRYIYIHGTNGENIIGTPSSKGCIRLTNDDAITAHQRIPLGTPVLITERE
ncbi:MAG: family 78 glycoside hydrolase catalytic domain [Candidatus Hydrogenedentota bacterium]